MVHCSLISEVTYYHFYTNLVWYTVRGAYLMCEYQKVVSLGDILEAGYYNQCLILPLTKHFFMLIIRVYS